MITGFALISRAVTAICVFTAAAVMPAQRTERVLHNFEFAVGGQTPMSGLARDSAGNLYGTTEEGGVYGFGVVFKIDSAGNETLVHSFNGADGTYPTAGVTLDSAGNIYGTVPSGGAFGNGVVYKLAAAVQTGRRPRQALFSMLPATSTELHLRAVRRPKGSSTNSIRRENKPCSTRLQVTRTAASLMPV